MLIIGSIVSQTEVWASPFADAGGPHVGALAAATTAAAPSHGGAYSVCMSHLRGWREKSLESL